MKKGSSFRRSERRPEHTHRELTEASVPQDGLADKRQVDELLQEAEGGSYALKAPSGGGGPVSGRAPGGAAVTTPLGWSEDSLMDSAGPQSPFPQLLPCSLAFPLPAPAVASSGQRGGLPGEGYASVTPGAGGGAVSTHQSRQTPGSRRAGSSISLCGSWRLPGSTRSKKSWATPGSRSGSSQERPLIHGP